MHVQAKSLDAACILRTCGIKFVIHMLTYIEFAAIGPEANCLLSAYYVLVYTIRVLTRS